MVGGRVVYSRVCLGVRVGGGAICSCGVGWRSGGGWIRVWVVSDVLVGVSVRWGGVCGFGFPKGVSGVARYREGLWVSIGQGWGTGGGGSGVG